MYKEEDRDGFKKRSLKCRSVVRNIRTKKWINLYQREVKKGAVAGQIVTLAAFLVSCTVFPRWVL